MIYKGSGMFDDDGGTPFQFDHNYSHVPFCNVVVEVMELVVDDVVVEALSLHEAYPPIHTTLLQVFLY